jgi:hypothetical protein
VIASAIPEGFHQVLIRFQNLMVQIPHILSLRPAFGVCWYLGVGPPGFGRLTLATPANEAVSLKQMTFTTTTMTLERAAPMRALDVTVFIQTSRRYILGGLALPPGATVALQSSFDRNQCPGCAFLGAAARRTGMMSTSPSAQAACRACIDRGPATTPAKTSRQILIRQQRRILWPA